MTRVTHTVASKLPTKRRGGSSNEKQTVAQLTSLAYEHGINSADLDVLLAEVITAGGPGRLDQASLAAIVRNLYPASRVSSEAVLAVVGCLGHGELRPSLVIQAMLLRWLILVHHVLESRDVLARAYGVLFNLLDTAAIR